MVRALTLITLLVLPVVSAGVSTAAEHTWPWENARVSDDQWLAHSEPSIAQDPTNPDVLVGASKMFSTLQGGPNGYRFKVGTYRSEDGGKTWEDQGMLGGDDPNNSWTQLGYGNTTDPSVAFDARGNVYVQIMVYQGLGYNVGGTGVAGENCICVYRSTDKGKTWDPPIEISHIPPGAAYVAGSDKNWITVDATGGPSDGFLYATWTYLNCVLTCHNVYFSASYDGGDHWTSPRIISITGSPLNQTSTPVVGPDGTVYVVFHDYSNHVLYLTKSSDHGATFTRPAPIANISPPGTLNGNIRSGPLVIGVPAVLDDGTIHVVWNELGNDVDVVRSTSTDGGTTWSSPVPLSTDTQQDQFQPWITRTAKGDLWAMWFDRRHDPANMRIHVYAARSGDGGQTWAEYRVTDVDSDPRVGLPLDRGNRGFYGDYQGLVADDQTGAQLLWNETRPGSQELFFARVNPRQSRMTATASGGLVEVSGHAGFRGNSGKALLSEDATGDAPVPAPQAGLDMVGARVFQPDPYADQLAFEFHTSDLPEPRGSVPEGVRYVWGFTTGSGPTLKTYLLQAKLTNVASSTLADEQEGHVTNAGAAFQLRGNCALISVGGVGVTNNCAHIAWLTGHLDPVRNVVRVFLPMGASYTQEISAGATLKPFDYAGGVIYVTPQAVLSQATVYDLVEWLAEDAYQVPSREAFIGIAPAGTPAGEVTYDALALDANDDFSASLAGGAGDAVYLKSCFEGRCEVVAEPVG